VRRRADSAPVVSRGWAPATDSAGAPGSRPVAGRLSGPAPPSGRWTAPQQRHRGGGRWTGRGWSLSRTASTLTFRRGGGYRAWARRGLAALLLVSAALLATAGAPAQPGPNRSVLIAARDLSPGALLSAEDVRRASLPVAAVPSGALSDPAQATGRTVTGAVRKGELLTDVRLIGPALLVATAGAGAVATPVRLADPDATALLRAGDVVDVLAAPTAESAAGQPAQVVAAGVPVLAVPAESQESALVDGALIVVATTAPVAARLATAAVHARLSVTVLPPDP